MPGLEGKVLTGSDFSQMASGYSWQERDSLSLDAFGKGSIPPFYRRFIPVKVMGTDAVGEKHKAVFFVAPDYFMIGNASDWVRVPLTPMAAQVVADRLDCFLPTKKLPHHHLRNYIAVHIGEAEIAALKSERELFVIHAKQVKNGGVQIVDVTLV